MAYKFITASLPITGKTQKSDYISFFQETLNQQFYNSSDWWTILEETPFASGEYAEIDVRINHLINAETGIKLGDDWKLLLFKEVDHQVKIGKFYQFDNNTWLVTNTEVVKNLTGTCTVKRCNNVLRWIDEKTGSYYYVPCSIEYLIKEPRDYSTAGSSVVTPSGYLQIMTQFNDKTNTIRPNQRFLFGNKDNWTGYKVVGTGMNNLNNLVTTDNMSSGMLRLDMVANYVNYETDDLVNGVADVTQNVYTLDILESSLSGKIGDTFQLNTLVTFNGDSAVRTLNWASSDELVATVSQTGAVTMISNGNATITANIENNVTSDTCSVVVSTVPFQNIKIIVSPDINYVYEGYTQSYDVYLYVDDIIQADVFTITCNPNSVPSSNYVFSQTGNNSFTVKNNAYFLTDELEINFVSGTNSSSMNIMLKGVW